MDPSDDTETFMSVAVDIYVVTEDRAGGLDAGVRSSARATTDMGSVVNLGMNQVTIDLDVGEDITCTFTNDDIAPTLTVTKMVVNDDGGTKVVGDFPLFVDGGPVTSGDTNTFTAGAHTVSETTDPRLQCDHYRGLCRRWHDHAGARRGQELHDHQRRHCAHADGDQGGRQRSQRHEGGG